MKENNEIFCLPEWYFLCQYAILKAVPNKNAGFIILLTSIFTFFLLGEIRNLTTLSLLPLVNNCFSLSFYFQSLLSFLWIGAQFPQVKFLSYGRILTLHYYFLLMCFLFSLGFLVFHLLYLPTHSSYFHNFLGFSQDFLFILSWSRILHLVDFHILFTLILSLSNSFLVGFGTILEKIKIQK